MFYALVLLHYLFFTKIFYVKLTVIFYSVRSSAAQEVTLIFCSFDFAPFRLGRQKKFVSANFESCKQPSRATTGQCYKTFLRQNKLECLPEPSFFQRGNLPNSQSPAIG
jgi:hypothetical protein